MKAFSQRERSDALERMAREGVDVFVIGGGITGVSVAMDAAARGYRVGLAEKADFASGTSSKSTKLVHGGLRYLPQFDFALVREALVERGLLFQNAPWIVRPLAFVLPLYRWNRRPLGAPFVPPFGLGLDLIVQAGLLLYDLLAGRWNIRRHRRLPLTEAGAQRPGPQNRWPDPRFHLLRRPNGRCPPDPHGPADGGSVGRIGRELRRGDRLRHHRGPDRGGSSAGYADGLGIYGPRAPCHQRRRGLCTAGGGADGPGIPDFSRAGQRGSSGLCPRQNPLTDKAVVLPETDDGRLLFLIPWGARVLVGTTDTEGGDVDDPGTTAQDVAYLLDTCNRYLRVPLQHRDILATYAGFRPLIKNRGAGKSSSASLSRSHAVLDGPAGMVSIVGGKLTTWRRMAEDTMDHVARRDGSPPSVVTRALPLDGSAGWPGVARVVAGRALALPLDIRAHLCAAYGGNLRQVLALAEEDARLGRRVVPDLPYLLAEVVYACRYEMALTLDDVLSRRTRLVLEDTKQGIGIAGEVAEVMAAELGWDEAEIARQVTAYTAIVRREYQERLGNSPP